MRLVIAIISLILLGLNSSSFADPTSKPSTQPIDLSNGWTLVKEGDAEVVIDPDAKLADREHLLRINLTKQAERGKGRGGAAKDIQIPIEHDHFYDISFSAVTERGSVGLVFSLETPDGKVLARTTLPEIGRIGRGRANNPDASTRPTFAKYSVSLHARDDASLARLVITPIEVTNIWLDDLTFTPRE